MNNFNWQFPEYCNGDKERWKELSDKCKVRDNYTCKFCGSKVNLQAHHIVSKANGGRDVLSNLITVCKDCHAKKHNHMQRKKPIIRKHYG